ncbi:Arc family DNA-binding protein [Leclercia tamurae]|uniref:Arc family DNA-binding protein n=1 Tax=Leclercia tamurae TaxID=2926467 RepID=UPI0036F49E69
MKDYDEVQFHLRLPPDVHEKVKQRAKANGRSINLEIIRTLEQSFFRGSTAQEDSDERVATLISDRVREIAIEIIKREKTRS